MSYYTRAEQETHYVYDAIEGNWRVSSSYPPHIRQILERGQVHHTTSDDEGRIIAVEGYVDRNQIRLFKPILKEND